MSNSKINLKRISIMDLQKAMEENQITSYEITVYYLSQIAKYDSIEAGLNSVLEVNPDALAMARMADVMRKEGKIKGPLHGVPVLIKDNINTNDKMHTSAGSISLKDNYATYDAHLIALLREAGAVILGKANLTEFANILTRGMRNGYSSRGGCVISPYGEAIDPLGSSTGSAVAVAADLCTVSIGTETFGSILSPAMVNGVVGIKPTLGMVSRHGIIPVAHSFDTAGPFGRTVMDAALLLDAITGFDENDPITYGAKKLDYQNLFNRTDLNGVRIGVNKSDIETLSPLNIKLKEDFLTTMKNNGAKIVELDRIKNPDILMTIVKYELKADMNYYLSTTANGILKSMKEIIEFNESNAEIALKYGQSLFLDSQNDSSGKYNEPDYIEALLKRENVIRQYNEMFEENNIDVFMPFVSKGISALIGFPGLNLPIGYMEENVPVGAYLVGRPFEDSKLIDIAYVMEKIWDCMMVPSLDKKK